MKNIAFFGLIFLSFSIQAQEDAWVYFTGKPNAATSISNPLSMLTQRAIDRRTTQGIVIDMMDVPVHQAYIDQIETATGITVLAKSKWLNAVHVQGSQSEIQILESLSFVANVDFANKLLNSPGNRTPPKPVRSIKKLFETEVVFNYGNSANQIQMLGGHLLHQQNYTGAGKIIAVMDGGFPGVNTASTFQRLRDNNQILGGYDYVSRDPNFYTGISHGTMVLSCMGGYKNGELVGTAPDASYYLFITEDSANEWPLEESLWVEAAEEADRLGVDIINTSLGYTEFDKPEYDHTYADMNGTTTFISRGLNAAHSRGMICVTSAGNSGTTPWYYISAPADATHALAVGATNASGALAGFSSRGPTSDGRIKPDVTAQGQASVISNMAGVITTASGTSFSGPITAGMVASLWQAIPNKTNDEIIQLIKESASLFTNPNNNLGYGIPNFNESLNRARLSVSDFNKNELALYPNPTSDLISVVLPITISDALITFYNALGQVVLSQKLATAATTLSLESLNSGIYFYKIDGNLITKTGRIIKN